ncbi:MAG: response regulator [Phycisphaerae bacterium]|nr:response regulator [Tepidisphaeraceae bacterium]
MILIVEDDPLARRALEVLLRANGYPTRTVSSAEEAMASLRNSDRPDLVLIDVDLPGMNGLELLRWLRLNHPDLHCTLMSADSQEQVRRSREPVPFLPKPLDTRRLLSIASERHRRPGIDPALAGRGEVH